MRKFREQMAVISVALLIGQPVVAMAGSSVRLIPDGTVGVLSDGKVVQEYRSETVLPEGSMLVCDGKCALQAGGLQLVARDKAVFAVAESESSWDVAVKNGRIDFGVKQNAKSIAFHTSRDVVRVSQAIIPAGTDGVVRGSLSVTANESKLSVDQGTLKVSYNGNEVLVQPGLPIILAQADAGAEAGELAAETPAAGDPAAGATAAVPPSAGSAVTGASATATAAGAGTAGGTILGMSSTTALVAGGGLLAAGIAGGVTAASSKSGGQVSPSL